MSNRRPVAVAHAHWFHQHCCCYCCCCCCLTITLLAGETVQLPYRANMTVAEVKEQLRRHTGVDTGRQSLIHSNTELRTVRPEDAGTGRRATLGDYGVTPASPLQLLVCLHRFGTLENVWFDLSWGPTSRGPGFLDVSCLVFAVDGTLLGIANVENPVPIGEALMHWGDYQCEDPTRLQQRIEVKMSLLEERVACLFFVLTTFERNRVIGDYSLPAIALYDSRRPDQLLGNMEIATAVQQSAIVMCALHRTREDPAEWAATGLGRPTQGNIYSRAAIVTTCTELLPTLVGPRTQ